MSFSICFNFCISNEIHFIYCNAITIVKFSSLSQSLTLVFIISVHGQNLLSAYDAWYFLGVGRRNCSVCCLSQIRQGQQTQSGLVNQWVYWNDLQEHAKLQGSYITKMYPTMSDNSEQLCPAGPSSTCRQQLSPQKLCPALRTLGAVGLCEVHFLSLGRLKLFQSLKNSASFLKEAAIQQLVL